MAKTDQEIVTITRPTYVTATDYIHNDRKTFAISTLY